MTVTQKPKNVDGEEIIVSCRKEGKTVWVAYGDYNGKHITAKGNSERDAYSKWKDKVHRIDG